MSAATSTLSAQTAFLVDDFQKASSVRYWQFSNGAEFPGASGSISRGEGHSGSGARLNFQIRCNNETHTCGHYVGAYKFVSPPAGSTFHALSLWVSYPPEMRLVVRIKDETGQTLQYSANAPTLEHEAANSWSPVMVSLDVTPDGYWGGANNGQLNGAITQVGVLADSANPVASKGVASFDDVWLLPSPATVLDLDSSTPIAEVPSSSLSLSSRLGANIHDLNDDIALNSARSAGFSFVRTDLTWATIEKNGSYNFTSYDQLLSGLEGRGMGVLWILDYGHPDHGGSQPRTRADVAAYARYAQAAASHFRGHNVRYEVWNEENSTSFMPNPSMYPEMLSQAVTAIREVDASVPIVTGGVDGIDLAFLENNAMAAPVRKTDAVGVHPYRKTAPETLGPDLMLLRQLVNGKFRNDMPIWDTEWGYSSCGLLADPYYEGNSDEALQRQAVLTARQLLTVWTLGLPMAVWYDLRDDGTDPSDPESNFGLLDQNDNDKPAMQAVRMLTSIGAEGSLAGIVVDPPAGVHALRLDNASSFTYIVWCDAHGMTSQIRFPSGSFLSANTMLGQAISISSAGSGLSTVSLSEADGPVYLHLARPRSTLVTHNPSQADVRLRP